MSITLDFGGTNVLVVGGTSGINLGVAQAFAEQGARVAVASRSQDKVDAAVASLRQKGAAESRGFSADVRNYDDLVEGINQLHQAWGDVDTVVSGAAGNFPATVKDMSSNAFKSVVDIDLIGTFHVMKAIFPCLKKPGASVVNISAPQAILPMVAQAHVCAAKAGVDMLTRTLCQEWGASGVRINSVIPGPIEGTEGMARLAPTEEDRRQTLESVPLHRMGQPGDIANVCLFLASPLASYISGAVIPVDGGWVQNGASSMGNTLAHLAAAKG